MFQWSYMYQISIYRTSEHALPKVHMSSCSRRCRGTVSGGAWYKEPIKGEWKRLLAKGITNHLIISANHSKKITIKDQILERARMWSSPELVKVARASTATSYVPHAWMSHRTSSSYAYIIMDDSTIAELSHEHRHRGWRRRGGKGRWSWDGDIGWSWQTRARKHW